MVGSQPEPERVRRRPGRLVLWGGVGGLVGVYLDQSVWGLASGAALGSLWGGWRAAEARADALAAELAAQAERLRRLTSREPASAEPPAEPAAEPSGTPPVPVPRPDSDGPSPARTPAFEAPAGTPPAPPGPSLLDRGVAALRGLLLGGNTVVRVGVLVLLVGVLLLAKWAADNALFPVEARLAVSALIGLALTVVGYRLREARPGFGTTLQGGGIAALYLVVFVALRLFGLVPPGLAFALFAVIGLGGGVLAVRQRAQPLMFIGSLGGFLAPILASTGQGSHVVLFGYYLVLDLAIAAAAWRCGWRPLALLAFACTYGVATAWGVLRYRPEHFATTEPFVLAYLVVFTGLAVAFAWRRAPRLAGLVDGTLVFGTALVTLLAQARLVEDVPFGMAWSSAGLGLFYAGLGTWLWRTAPDTLRRLSEAFVALAVGFGTLALPFALDDGFDTTMAWALEGAGLYWVGTRQARASARIAGVGLQALAAGAFVVGLDPGLGVGPSEVADRPLANARFFACAALAFAGGFVAREAWAARGRLVAREWQGAQLLAVWGLLWWVGGGRADVDAFVDRERVAPALLGFTAVTALGQEWLAARLAWAPGRWLALWCVPAGFVWLALALATQPHLLANGGALAWPALFGVAYWALGRTEPEAPWLRGVYGAAFTLVALVVPCAALGLAYEEAGLSGDWPLAAFGVGLAGVLLAGGVAADRGVGPFGRLAGFHVRVGFVPAAALALLWIVVLSALGRGDAEPLPYLPLLTPVDPTGALLALVVLDAWRRLVGRDDADGHAARAIVPPLLLGLAFLWLNAAIARSVHRWEGVPFEADALWASTPFQVSLSIAWAVVGLAGMWTATRLRLRPTWIAFATLLGVVVVKLFAVDLSQLGTAAKIGTFLVVGVLLLVVGWLSPVPPGDTPGGPGDAPEGPAPLPEGPDTPPEGRADVPAAGGEPR